MVMQQIQIPTELHQLRSKYRDLPSGIVLFKIERVIQNRPDHEPVGRFENHQTWPSQPGSAPVLPLTGPTGSQGYRTLGRSPRAMPGRREKLSSRNVKLSA